jgi:hypothetical protein
LKGNTVDLARSIGETERSAGGIAELAAKLANRDPCVRERARETLVALGRWSVPELMPLLSAERPHVRWEAAKALGSIADPGAAPALVAALEDDNRDVRWLAAEGLIAMGREGLVPLMSALITSAPSYWLCEGAHHICHALAQRKRLSAMLRPVVAALEQDEPAIGVPLAAYRAISKLRELGGGH